MSCSRIASRRLLSSPARPHLSRAWFATRTPVAPTTPSLSGARPPLRLATPARTTKTADDGARRRAPFADRRANRRPVGLAVTRLPYIANSTGALAALEAKWLQ